MVLVYPYYFNGGVNKMKTVDYYWVCDDFGCYFGIIQLFLGHSIDMVHSCIAMLKIHTMLSKLSGKILILIKKIIIFFPKSFLNYYIEVISLNQT